MYDSEFVKIYETQKVKLYSYVLFKTKSQAVAEDIASTVFLKLFKEIQANRKVLTYAIAWLYRTASNQIIDYHRSSYYKQTSTETEEVGRRESASDSDNGGDTEVFVTEYTAMLDSLAQEEKQKMVMESLKELRAEDQEVIELRLYQELPFKQLAVILESTESAVKMKYGRAIEKLKEIVNKKYEN